MRRLPFLVHCLLHQRMCVTKPTEHGRDEGEGDRDEPASAIVPVQETILGTVRRKGTKIGQC